MPPSHNQEIARQLFLRLVTLGEGTEDTRRRALQSELYSLGGDEMQAVIRAFDESRLLTFDRDPLTREPTVELAHEAIIREWSQLRTWLDESRDDVRQQRLLAAAANEWLKNGHDTSYLLSGARLAQFEDWYYATGLALTEDEHTYLHASLEERQRQAILEAERQSRELRLAHEATAAAEEAAAAQRQAANRLRYAVAIFLIAAMVGLGLAIFAFGQRNQAQNSRATSVANAQAALNAQATSIANANAAQQLALVNGARAALAQGDYDTALTLSVAANNVANPSAQAQVILSEAAYIPGTVLRLVGHNGIVNSIAISPDGHIALAGGEQGDIIAWDLATGEVLQRFTTLPTMIQSLSFSPDSQSFVSVASDSSITLWDMETGTEVRQFKSPQIYNDDGLQARFSPDGRTILTNNGALPHLFPGQVPALLLWDVETAEVIRTFLGHSNFPGGIAISPDGRTALSGALFGEMILWDMATGDVLQRFGEISEDWRKVPSHIVFNHEGDRAVAKLADNTLVMWDLTTYSILWQAGQPLKEGELEWADIAFSPDGQFVLASNIANITTELRDAQSGALLATFPSNTFGLAFAPDGKSVLYGWQDVRLWDLFHGSEIQRFDSAADAVATAIALSPNGRTLATAITNNVPGTEARCEIVLLDVDTGQELRRFGPTTPPTWQWICLLNTIAFSPDGTRLLSASIDDKIILWDVATGQPLRTLSGHFAKATWVTFSPDGHTALSGGLDGVVIMWDLATGQEIHRFIGHKGGIWDVAFSPDGRTAVSSSQDSTLILWDLATGQEIHRFVGHLGGINTVAFSPDGRTILAGDDNSQMILWDVAKGQPLRTFLGHNTGIGTVEYGLDGRTVFSSSDDAIIQWDIASGEAIHRYPTAFRMVLSPDGRSFFTYDRDYVIHQWRIDSPAEMMAWTLENRYIRDLTCTERDLYNLEPKCNAQGVFPTRTPFQTALPSPTSAPTATPDPAELAATPSTTVTPTLVPRSIQNARVGQNRGEVAYGDYQLWTYEGKAGETLTIRVEADIPANWDAPTTNTSTPSDSVLDPLILVSAPDGTYLNAFFGVGGFTLNPAISEDIETRINTDALVEGLVLPVDGVYQIMVSGYNFTYKEATGGAYTLTIESHPPMTPTADPAASEE